LLLQILTKLVTQFFVAESPDIEEGTFILMGFNSIVIIHRVFDVADVILRVKCLAHLNLPCSGQTYLVTKNGIAPGGRIRGAEFPRFRICRPIELNLFNQHPAIGIRIRLAVSDKCHLYFNIKVPLLKGPTLQGSSGDIDIDGDFLRDIPAGGQIEGASSEAGIGKVSARDQFFTHQSISEEDIGTDFGFDVVAVDIDGIHVRQRIW
jgi:hypothetical protein